VPVFWTQITRGESNEKDESGTEMTGNEAVIESA
jgi:hypothetical protein